MCKCLKVSRNAYYQWVKNQNKTSQSKVSVLKNQIKEIWGASRMIYGSPKITEELRRAGKYYHESYISRLMQQMGIMSITRKKYVATTDSKHDHPICKNVLDRDFDVDQLGKVWVSDITYIKCNDDWLYLTSMIDLADRKVVGWTLSEE